MDVLEKKKINRVTIWFLFMIIIIIKLYINTGIPRWISGDSPHDDMLFINYAKELVSGNWWLGNYSNHALNKRPGYAFFLAMVYQLHIPYVIALTLFDIIAAWVSMCAVKPLVKGTRGRLLWFMFFLYNPVAFHYGISLRIYRNALIPDAVLLVVFSLIGFFLRLSSKKKVLLSWGMLSGFCISYFWIIREDSIWLLPFIFAASLISILLIIFDTKWNLGEKMKRVVICFAPGLILVCSLSILKGINYHYYGIYTVTDFNETNFAYAVKNILKVKPEKEKSYIWVPKETFEKLYTISPTLKSLEKNIDMQYSIDSAWQRVGQFKEDGEIEKDFVIWALRDAVAQAGYYKDAKETDALYKKIGDELKAAFKNGELEERKGIMISSLARPITLENWNSWLECMIESIKSTLSYTGFENGTFKTRGSEKDFRLAEIITNGLLIYPENDFEIRGWLVSKNTDCPITLEMGEGEYDDVLYSEIPRTDVQALYGDVYENIENCGFTIRGKSYSEDLSLSVVTEEGDFICTVTNDYMENESFILCIDSVSSENISENMMSTASSMSMVMAQMILRFYQCVGVGLYIIALLVLIGTSMYEFIDMIRAKRKYFRDYDIIIPAAGIFMSMLVLHFGVSINYFDAYNRSGRIIYLGGSYPLQLGFIALMAVLVVKRISIWKGKKKEDSQM